MHAVVGDLLIIESGHVDESPRTGVILEVHGEDGGPPYVVRWNDDEHTSTVVPGTDARVKHLGGDSEAAPVSG